MDSLNLKSLIEVVRTGSFSKAAENLFVTQSAVSRRIKSLEEEYGCPLLDRSGVTMKPTEAGKLVIAEARKILAIEENLVRKLESRDHRDAINFACTHPFGITHLPDVLKRYMKRYSDLSDFKMSFQMPYVALQGLKDNRYDLIVIEHWALLDLSRFTALPLPGDEMIFVSSPVLGLSGPMVTIDELVRQRLYRRKEECCSWKYLTMNMEIAGRDVREFVNTVVFDDLHVIIESIKEGDGIALMSKDLVQKQIEEGTLCEHRVEGFNHHRKRSVIMKQPEVPNKAMRFLIDCIFASFDLETPALPSQ